MSITNPHNQLPPGSHMPYPRNPHFVGREKELNDLALRLIEGSAVRYPAVISTGIGGVGKSQLAVEFAYQYGRAFPGGVFWISFANPDAAEAEIARSGAGLKLSPHYDRLELAEQLRLVQAAWAEATPRLLIFDNLDDERGSWPAHTLLDKWRPRQGGCRLLVTSRRQTWPTAMGVWSLTLRTLPRHQSQALLNDLTRSGLTARLLDAIADELGDLPLALQLAGSYLHTYRHDVTPQAYLAELRAPGLLAHPSLQGRGAADYSPTDHDLDVARTFQVSMNRLNPDDAGDMLALDLLLRAARFAPGEPIPRDLLLATVAAQNEAESADPLAAADALRRLSDLGLVTITEKGAARLHRLLARFARELATPAAWEAEIVAAVEDAVINKAYAENTAGYPAALQSWEVHLRACD